ncbi:hypothetical protein BDN72DRAFT_566379 [Pluteus cervinus]|uniref:Uncharacterized protein n=1 Tax=Pluteus cervinus TaxID=181527 RepID=A0ACD3AXP8_9AGAR|nr:hypothetical protein BDN72DRAFT_566379 [Pluteus cervinus]
MPNFPVELIENVLEHLYADYDRYSGPHPLVLFPCALVCRTWRTIAQSIIFSEIILKYPSPIKTFQKNNQLRLLVRRVLIDHSPGSSCVPTTSTSASKGCSHSQHFSSMKPRY